MTLYCKLPEGFSLHRKLERAMQKRKKALDNLDDPSIDWATAEDLAFASILEDGTSIRLTGQDVERGTFSQRHSVFHDIKTGQRFVPLQAIPQARVAYEVRNSPTIGRSVSSDLNTAIVCKNPDEW